jgi:hypothetical protein
MTYTERFNELRLKYSTERNETVYCNFSDITIKNSTFQSEFNIDCINPADNLKDNFFFNSEVIGTVNTRFTYPIVKPAVSGKSLDIIILLHGLNERIWDKYLPWAHTLAENTGKAVILFPIAFHMNRSPHRWIDRQYMNSFVQERTSRLPDVKNSSFINVALSERLTMEPQRFFLSGYQAAIDIIQLVDEIRGGKNPMFAKDATIDFFSYSIGVLLSQVLLLGDDNARFARSKFFFFCGGSAFEGMHGISKYIIDSNAFTRIFDYYLNTFGTDQPKNGLIPDLLNHSILGNAFQFLISFKQFKKLPGNLLKRFREQVQTITLKKDTIIPSSSIIRTMRGTDIEEWDFNFQYTHENPFPVQNKSLASLVDKAFDSLMLKASLYLA